MVEAEGMGIAPWGAIGRGWFKSKEEYQRADREGRKMADQPEKYARIAAKLEEIANRKGKNVLITSIALAYVMHKAPYVFPIVGGRKVDHLKGNIDALGVKLSQEEIDEIDAAEPFDIGFPMNFLFGYVSFIGYNTTKTFASFNQHFCRAASSSRLVWVQTISSCSRRPLGSRLCRNHR